MFLKKRDPKKLWSPFMNPELYNHIILQKKTKIGSDNNEIVVTTMKKYSIFSLENGLV
jgi:hypothetical protein